MLSTLKNHHHLGSVTAENRIVMLTMVLNSVIIYHDRTLKHQSEVNSLEHMLGMSWDIELQLGPLALRPRTPSIDKPAYRCCKTAVPTTSPTHPRTPCQGQKGGRVGEGGGRLLRG